MVATNFNFLPSKLNFCCRNYSGEETIHGWKLHEEIWYKKTKQKGVQQKTLNQFTYAAHVNKTRYFTSASISVADLSTDDEQNIKKGKDQGHDERKKSTQNHSLASVCD